MSKEHAYAYEAGYRDGSINYELEHCPACKNVADLQEALAENAKLREEFNKMDVWHSKELTAAMAENTKLRKLVRDMMEFFEDGDWCVKCERALDCQEQEQYEDECLMRFVFRDRMRELGIEVDE